jgi:hypothetical protein
VAEHPPGFDPIGLFQTLDRHRVTYIVIGAFARVIQGADEVTTGIDIVPSTREENLRRLDAALEDLGACLPDGSAPGLLDHAGSLDPVIQLKTEHGELKIVPTPDGTRGYDDLRRAATNEPLGQGVRPSFASVGDLTRMLSAMGRDTDIAKVLAMRRLTELEISQGIEL